MFLEERGSEIRDCSYDQDTGFSSLRCKIQEMLL